MSMADRCGAPWPEEMPWRRWGDDFAVRDIPLHTLGHYRQRVAAGALARLPDFLLQGRERALRRVALLKGLTGISVVEDLPGKQGVWPFILLLMPDKTLRDKAMDSLWTSGLGVTRLFIHTLEGYPTVTPFLQPGRSYPNAEAFAARSLSISNSPWLSDDMFNQVLARLQAALG
ncbi:DegT/DnrJ/EryC1/StrS family aminotransferase [Acerihabitans sp. KWT182]|uniref:DegT/DnrJ/EryC1/StrS family aminotransferase n=1 Tax=Acerihabitans sp. KWT182 TaxID=3157919 RepID=A0AAU7Q9G3_9GAMM